MTNEIRQLWALILKDVRVELSEEFDRNFERKAFFNQPWPKRRREGKGSLMVASGRLRRSLKAKEDAGKGSITWTSSEPYAAIHNEGGTITVTKALKAHAWKEYYKLVPHISYRKDGSLSNSKRNRAVSKAAEMWKAIALMKVGSNIKMPKRRFIGNHPKVREAVERVLMNNTDEISKYILRQLKNSFK